MTDTQTQTPLPGVSPYLTIRGGRGEEAMAFYTKAFEGKELMRTMADDGKRFLHGRLAINGSIVMFSDDFPELRGGAEAADPAGVTMHLQVDDADVWYTRAVQAGATATMPLADQFWGDRFGLVTDPFGHAWSIGATIRRP